jgi:uncharacterized membrane protein
MSRGGSFCVIISLLFEFNLSAFAVEVAWLVVSFIGLARLALANRATTHNSLE